MKEWNAEGIRLVCGDCLEVLPTLEAGSVSSVVTDPVWPNASVPLIGADDPVGLWRCAWRLIPAACDRVAVHLGCDSDPTMLAEMGERWPFFRVCWLEMARPHYKGRLLYTGDVAYFYGEPPASEPGAIGFGGGTHFGTPTIEALVSRGVAEYTARKDGRSGRFPVEVTICEAALRALETEL